MSSELNNGKIEQHPNGRSSKKTHEQMNQHPPTSKGDSNVDQIRNLIFGEQMAGYEERFAQLEKKLTDEVNTMKVSVERSLDELRSLMKQKTEEVESASVPRKEIAASLEELAKALRGQ